MGGCGEWRSILLTYISQHCPSGATDWNQAQGVVPISFLGSGADLGSSGLQLGVGQRFSPWNHASVFPAAPVASKASMSSLAVQSGLPCSLSKGTT